MSKMRADQLLLDQGLAEDLKEARALLLSGRVLAGSQRLDKAGQRVDRSLQLRLKDESPYVSRGGHKLEGALRDLGVDVSGALCLDLGASTGGFTDCLLQHGARKVYALDVGKGQLHWKLRQDPRVEVREEVNVRYLDPSQIDEPADWIVADLSFISLRLVLPALKSFAPVRLLVLVKPQFEARRQEVESGGRIADEPLRQQVLQRLEDFCTEQGFIVQGRADAPLAGRKSGNQETFFLLQLA
ncbi:MAG TPA: TlyA family RNA methyltransferase [Acidobacteriota bacterium]|nr:TlyA family RNA methyltransferase [Acidobacteriota bacterium]